METIDFGFSKYSPPEDLRVFVTNLHSGIRALAAQAQSKGSAAGKSQPFGIPEKSLRQNRETIRQPQLDCIDR